MSHRISKPDVAWYLPGRKRPVAYTTKASSDLVGYLAADGLTFNEAAVAINYDDEAKAALTCFIDAGYGDTPMSEVGVR